MIKLYFKQAFHLLGENKLLSSISIIGTALAIAMIMVIVITLRATIAPFAPETLLFFTGFVGFWGRVGNILPRCFYRGFKRGFKLKLLLVNSLL